MKERKKIIYIDVDGTLLDFKSIDGCIISEIFTGNKLIKFIDKILWWINDLDMVGYSNFIFYTRMTIYSLLSLKNIKRVLKKYKELYSKYAKKQISTKLKNDLTELENNHYRIFMVTRNMYANCMSDFLNIPIIIVKNKNTFYSKLYNSYNISFIVGNNYMDDIVSCYLLNRQYRKHSVKKEVTPIYIGKSKIVKQIAKENTICFEKIEDFINYLKNMVN